MCVSTYISVVYLMLSVSNADFMVLNVQLFMNGEFVMTLKEVVRAKIHVMRERKRHETSIRMVGEQDEM